MGVIGGQEPNARQGRTSHPTSPDKKGLPHHKGQASRTTFDSPRVSPGRSILGGCLQGIPHITSPYFPKGPARKVFTGRNDVPRSGCASVLPLAWRDYLGERDSNSLMDYRADQAEPSLEEPSWRAWSTKIHSLGAAWRSELRRRLGSLYNLQVAHCSTEAIF
jgi:hypothetical protein